MLVLTRLEDEAIWVGDDVKLTVIRVSGGKVWLGFEAPRDVEIYRDEIKKAIDKDGKHKDKRDGGRRTYESKHRSEGGY